MSSFEASGFLLASRRRPAGCSERRCITRQDFGHQRTLVVGGVYTSSTMNDLLGLKHGERPFVVALKTCFEEHPILSTVIVGGDTETPEFATPKRLDLNKHLEIRDAYAFPEDDSFEKILGKISDEQFSAVDTTPPWKVVLLPLTPQSSSEPSGLLVLFAYYHSHGDGKSGLAFHRSFLKGLSRSSAQAPDHCSSDDLVCEPSANDLLPPIEEAGKLSLSWSYLLSPLLGAYLPDSLASLLGIRATWLPQDGNIWRGKKLTFDPENFQTGIVVLSVDHDTMRGALQHCKSQQATFTGLLSQLIVRTLGASDTKLMSADVFTSQIAVSMRHLFSGVYSNDSMTNCVTGYSESIPYQPYHQASDWATDPSSRFWAAARDTSTGLANAASTLHNQPIGLLQYLKEFRPWTVGQIGKTRESSFEISNLGVFEPISPQGVEQSITMERAVFSQPANASGALLNFNPVSIKGGPLIMTVTWQRGVLDLPEGKDESSFVREVCSRLEADIRELARISL